jgi:predicted unusual protein kinase regulating ubiquinone biosynthesis (AarF/ABC1/UbiB family)
MKKRNSAFGRALRLASTTTGAAGSYLGYLAQSPFLDADKRHNKLRAAHRTAWKRLAESLGQLRGPALKLGQTLSLQEGILPEEALRELSSLQMSAPPMHPSLVRAQFRQELGVDPENVFAAFDPVPFATASLGQVHNATGRKGEAFAIKVQYPAILETIHNDFKWFRTVSLPAQLSSHLPIDTLDEMQRQFERETDYEQEADNLDFFAKHLKPLKFVSVPSVIRKLSTRHILTMSKLTGMHLETFLAKKPSQMLRDKIGSHLIELFYFQILRLGRFHADPHWGNYLLRSDGTLGMVDFGCVKTLQPDFVAELRFLYLYPGPRDHGEFVCRLQDRYRLFGKKLTPKTRDAHIRFAENFYRRVYPPEREREWDPIDFGDPKWVKMYLRESGKLSNSRGTLPEYLFLARAELGLYQTLHKLGARTATSGFVRRYQ